jgi:hypothetical protein
MRSLAGIQEPDRLALVQRRDAVINPVDSHLEGVLMTRRSAAARLGAVLFLVGVCAAPALFVSGRSVPFALMSADEMATLIGGSCSQQCYNYCNNHNNPGCSQLTNECSQAQGSDGAVCSGGGGGQGDPTFTCVFAGNTSTCDIDQNSNPTHCTPSIMCTCQVQGGANKCMSLANPRQQTGRVNCTNGTCSS